MQRIFKLRNNRVCFKLVGKSSGGFNSKYTTSKIADQNLCELANSFNCKSATLMLPACHSDVAIVDANIRQVNADVLITKQSNHGLLLRPADCLPLLLFTNKDTNVLTLIHASRHGLEEGIIEKTITKLQDLNIDNANLQAYIGPSIKKDSYILPTSITDQLQHPSWRGAIVHQSNAVSIDLPSFAKSELTRLGVNPSLISTSRIDTSRQNYYSHYRSTREGDTNGRNGLVAVITPLIK